ncbi:MAG: Protein-arginine kinase activator protein [Planctomycetes bacterium]|nr:Protein-arginine kinase activator protein [Planctomycetota bacterium]
MKCQSCTKRAATVHYTEISDNKESREIHLCEDCYNQQKPGGSADILGLISGAFSGAGRPADDPGALTCPNCGLTYAAFRQRGRLGCPQCWETFSEPLTALLEKIHNGGTRHVGKSPFGDGPEGGASTAADRSAEREIVALRRKLTDAIKGENYELAASLRDALKQAEERAADARAEARADAARSRGPASGGTETSP